MRISDWSSDVCSSDLSRGSKTSSGNRTSPFRIIAHMPLRKAAVMACSSPCETAASTTATSLSRPGKSSAGETEAFRSEEHTSELQSLMRISYAVFCLKKKKQKRKQKVIHNKIAIY